MFVCDSVRELGLIRKRTLSSSSLTHTTSASSKSTSTLLYNSLTTVCTVNSLTSVCVCVYTDQLFSYLIIIDFESTCWREKNNHGQEISESALYTSHCVSSFPHHISSNFLMSPFICSWFLTPLHVFINLLTCSSLCSVEFPAVLMNTHTGQIESEFHSYIQPQEHPLLSSFCTELTGITQVHTLTHQSVFLSLHRYRYACANTADPEVLAHWQLLMSKL